jgi:ribonuclease VapC
MIVDTSALICLIREEPEASDVDACLTRGLPLRMSTATASELILVMTHILTPKGMESADLLITSIGIDLVPYDAVQLGAFRHAYLTYGRGGHNNSPARLNLGDCFSYALAKTRNEALLFVGNDFTHTDIIPAINPLLH